MSHVSVGTNGASLEDCHTNVFVLTELHGLKWVKLGPSGSNGICTDVADDPVLGAYGRCLTQGQLCVWRRSPSQMTAHAPAVELKLSNEKELWIFWYGDEPDWKSFSQLTKLDEGSWDGIGGISYEVRTLLFKALHNLVERCLLQREFVRLGKWFVQPLDADRATRRIKLKYVLAFSFTFFLHGENNVCISVDLQQQPAVFKLDKTFLQHENQQVVLVPWGLSAVLSGEECSESDSAANKLWSEWSNFYPLPEGDNTENMGYVDPLEEQQKAAATKLPKMVEVVVGGVRMKYPSGYVVIIDDDLCDTPSASPRKGNGCNGLTPPCSPDTTVSSRGKKRIANKDDEWFASKPCGSLDVGRHVLLRTSQDSIICKRTATEVVLPEELPGVWEFRDVAHHSQKIACGCPKKSVATKAQLKFGFLSNAKHRIFGSMDKNGRPSRNVPFHKRSNGTTLYHADQYSSIGVASLNFASDNAMGSFTLNVCPTPSQDDSATAGNASEISAPRFSIGGGNDENALSVNVPLHNLPSPCGNNATLTATTSSEPSVQMISPVTQSLPVTPQKLVDMPHSSGMISSLQMGIPSTSTFASTCPSVVKCPSYQNMNSLNGGSQQPSVTTLRTISSDCTWTERGGLIKYELDEVVQTRFVPDSFNNRLCEEISFPDGDVKMIFRPSMFSPKLSNLIDGISTSKRPKLSVDCEDNEEDIATPQICVANYTRHLCWNTHKKKALLLGSGFSRDCNGEAGQDLSREAEGVSGTEESLMNGDYKSNDSGLPHDSSAAASGSDFTLQNFTAQRNQFLSNTGALPEKFLDDIDSDKDEPEMIMTPPPSNEQKLNDGHVTLTSTVSSKTCCKVVSGFSGPGSTGMPQMDFNRIYPTPPSIEQRAHSVFSPADLYAQSIDDVSPNLLSTCSQVKSSRQPAFESKATGMRMPLEQRDNLQGIFVKPITANFMTASDFAVNMTNGESQLQSAQAMFSKLTSSTFYEYKPSGGSSAGLWPSVDVTGPKSISQSSALPQSAAGLTAQSTWMPSVLDYPPSAGEPPVPSVGSSRGPEPSPANPSSVYSIHNHRTPKTPGIADLQSPASSSSSCIRNVSSVDNMPSAGLVPEAHSLVVNLLLCDTFVNVYRDASFESCVLCACDMTVKGVEMGIYVVPPHTLEGPLHSKCMCGYSAIRHRYLSHRSGIFYEDEMEITGLWQGKRLSRGDPSLQFSSALVDLVRTQCLTTHAFCSMFVNKSSVQTMSTFGLRDLEYRDFLDQCNTAIEQGCLVMDCTLPSTGDFRKAKCSVLSKWGFLSSSQAMEEFQALSVLRSLLEPLQASLQKCRGLWQTKHGVEGPLTWRFFHRGCFHRHLNSGKENQCEAEPIPPLMLSNERDFITISPYSLQFWDKLMLEPYSQPRDVAYIVVAPDSPEILNQVRSYFRELSKVYESCHFGRHCPITKVLKDGIMRIGKTRAKALAQKEVNDWFTKIEMSGNAIGPKLKLYAQVCRHHLALALDSNSIDSSIFRDATSTKETPTSVTPLNLGSMPPPPIPSEPSLSSESATDKSDPSPEAIAEENALNPPVVVIYMVNPFTYGPESSYNDEIARLATTGLLRSYLEMLPELPPNIRNNTQLQILPLQVILDGVCDEHAMTLNGELRVDQETGLVEPPHGNNWLSGSSVKSLQNQLNHMKSIAMSVYAQSRSVSLQSFHAMQAKTLTGFGPSAARAELIRKNEEHFTSYRVYCPPYILAPGWNRSISDPSSDESLSLIGGGAACSSAGREACSVLFVSYCLSEQQNWLFATCTDQVGELLESTVINMNVPDRKFCQRGTVIREAMKRLWEFILCIVATGTKPWRLVVGKVGRIGHGELRAWLHYLNKSSLKYASRIIKSNCSQCPLMPSFHDVPCILSACLVSLEPEVHLRVFSKSFSPVERFGQGVKQSPLSTPEDASCTHILVFPTSAITQISTGGAAGHENNPGTEDPDDFFSGGFLDLDDDLLQTLDQDGGIHGRTESMTEAFDESLQQQPLATGYYISTAPPGPLPSFFWANCPSAQFRCPTHLKSALLIHTASAQQSEEILNAQKSTHPLDSQLTTDALRYVLETYNALSWLNIDVITGDRRSCLPVHIQALLRLYHATALLL